MFSLRRFKPVGTLKFPAPLLHWSVGPPFADAANYTLRFSIRKTKKAARGGSVLGRLPVLRFYSQRWGKCLRAGTTPRKERD